MVRKLVGLPKILSSGVARSFLTEYIFKKRKEIKTKQLSFDNLLQVFIGQGTS